jgi:hypothetical protein
MRKIMQIQIGHLTITADNTNGKDTVKLTTTSEQTRVSVPVKDMNISGICCFRET